MNRKIKTALSGAGFYVLLILCLTVVGTGAYFLLFRGKTSPPAPDTAQQTSEKKSEFAKASPEKPVAKQIELPEKTVEQAEQDQTEKPVDTTPVVAEPPCLVVSPLNGEIVAVFAVDELQYSETMEDWRTHSGIDISAAQGTKVLAASAGTVASVADDPLMGTTVVLSHSGGYQTAYASLQAQPNVKKGDIVSAGQVIGAVGSTSIAESAEGPHLHFSVTKDGDAVDPEVYLKS